VHRRDGTNAEGRRDALLVERVPQLRDTLGVGVIAIDAFSHRAQERTIHRPAD
jgi:hypothetical protein